MNTLTILGSGTVDPQPDRASSGYLVSTGKGQFMVDCGSGTLRNGITHGVDMSALQSLVLTHLHPDHTVDLVPLLFARKYAPGGWQQRRPLSLYGPPGTSDFLKALYAAWPSIEPSADSEQVVLEEVRAGTAFQPVEDVTVHPYVAKHGTMNAFSYRVHSGGKTLTLSGDTALCDGVVEAAMEADLFVCECSCFPRGCEPLGCREVHLSWEDVAEICERSAAKKLILTHLYKIVLETEPGLLKPLREKLDIPVELAADGATYDW